MAQIWFEGSIDLHLQFTLILDPDIDFEISNGTIWNVIYRIKALLTLDLDTAKKIHMIGFLENICFRKIYYYIFFNFTFFH